MLGIPEENFPVYSPFFLLQCIVVKMRKFFIDVVHGCKKDMMFTTFL